MNGLLIVQFETGDSSVRYYEVPVVVQNCTWGQVKEIEDSFSSFIETMDEDLDYEDIVDAVMSHSGFDYTFIQSDIPSCKYVRTIQI